MHEESTRLCSCGSGRRAQECCIALFAPPDLSDDEQITSEDAFDVYHHFDDMRRAMRSLIPVRNPLESAVRHTVDPAWVDLELPVDPKRRPAWLGIWLNRETLAYVGREWSDEKGAQLQQKLYVLCEGFGDYMQEQFGLDADRVVDYEHICENFCDWLLMYFMSTPLEVAADQKPIHRYLGNYYPRTVTDANLDTIFHSLTALPAFYAWMHRLGLVRTPMAKGLIEECRNWEWYRKRLLDYVDSEEDDRVKWCLQYDYKSLGQNAL